MSTNTVENTKPAETFQTQDPAEAIIALLLRNGCLRPEAWLEHLDQEAYQNASNQDQKRFLINRTWRIILTQLDNRKIKTTLDERYSLVDTCDLATWLSVFEQSVIPCIISYNLPLTTQ